MNKLILLVSLLLLGIIGGFQEYPENTRIPKLENFVSNQGDSILWSRDRKLSIDDFKAVPNYKEPYAARTGASILMNSETYKDSIIIYINNKFVTNKSWVKKEQIHALLLEHEQGHFDISELGARNIRKELANYISKNKDLTIKFIYSVYNEQIKQRDDLDNKYDNETNFSRDDEKQKEWTAKIDKMLNDLEAYSSPKVVIKRVGW